MNYRHILAGLLLLSAGAFECAAGPFRRHAPARKVDTPVEHRIDRNKDGWVQPVEGAAARRHAYLRRRSDVDRPWEKMADANNDGEVDGRELRAFHVGKLDANGNGRIEPAERREYWRKRWRVNTAVEKKYDANGDGFLEWPEAREMLKDKHTLILTHGEARVDTDLELEFDLNVDGIIDRAEAPGLLAALNEAD